MSDTVIKVDNLSKKYVIRHEQRERYTALRDVMAAGVKRLGRRLLSPFTIQYSPFTVSKEDFYALRDVSFEIKQGDRVGIIGRNGAGKSTLLKILSRITEPTSGRIEIEGRVASLLEVGTGFHPELTGRENIFLNGAILGMTRTEIKKKFDEIVAFAEVERFLDTPVKRYSSGMYVRLAFAVAAHLEPEILIIDEVLAVGDAQFQKKCLGKMEEVGKAGRTVLFVSHNMGAIENLCPISLCLDAGIIIGMGETKDIIKMYLTSQSQISLSNISQAVRPNQNHLSGEILFQSVWAQRLDGETKNQFEMNEPFLICFKYHVKQLVPSSLIAVRIATTAGQIIIDSWDVDSLAVGEKMPGNYTVKVKVDPQDLHPGLYNINLVAAVHLIRWIDRVDNALQIEILPFDGDKVWRTERSAILQRVLQWEELIDRSAIP